MSFEKFWDSITFPEHRILTDLRLAARAAYEQGYKDGKRAALQEYSEKVLKRMSDRHD